MITFFRKGEKIYAVESAVSINGHDVEKLEWLFGGAQCTADAVLPGPFIGPRREMVTPWSTNAVEITQNMGIAGISRIEEFNASPAGDTGYDPMLQHVFPELNQEIFHILREPEPILYIRDIAAYNIEAGLALSEDEVKYLTELGQKLKRKLTDSEVFGFSQVNSEHCRHKIFNGTFIIDGEEMPESLFALIKKTAKEHRNFIASAYSDNVAFIFGPDAEQFAPDQADVAGWFRVGDIRTVISLKAETHNFPTTVEPFNGAATGSGGEIRDRMAGGMGSIPMAGTAVYMTSYPRLDGGRPWERNIPEQKWLYHSPEEILIRASNGASDFGNKFGQPLICGSLLTFEHPDGDKKFGYDKVIMQAGGIGYSRREYSQKDIHENGERIVVLGGDNYRIGMGGGAVSSVATGEYGNSIELNAVQRSNPEMQKRVFNAIRALVEMDNNPVISIHDHGAGGHLNSLSELVEANGGVILTDRLPIGDPTLSAKEILSNESQERMGLVIRQENLDMLLNIADRERAPIYVVGKVMDDQELIFMDERNGERPIELKLEDFFGKPPKTILTDSSRISYPASLIYDQEKIHVYLEQLLQLEAVACKDWLTNKVDRAVSGKIARQQSCGQIQLPLNNVGLTALDYRGTIGIATSLGHAPVAGLLDPAAASRLSVARALTNIVWAPLTHKLSGVSLSANWMWPCKNPGEDARLYQAVKALSDFAIALGINVPTGKDSLSMTQKYPDGSVVFAPGTVIVSAVGEVSDVKKTVSPNLIKTDDSSLFYIPFTNCGFELGGSSFGQALNQLGDKTPDVPEPVYFAQVFNAIQQMVEDGDILAGHDIAAGGLITTLFEMTFPVPGVGLNLDLTGMGEGDPVRVLFSERPGIVVQMQNGKEVRWQGDGDSGSGGIQIYNIGELTAERNLKIQLQRTDLEFDIDSLRNTWFKTSYLLDRMQSGEALAKERYQNFGKQQLNFRFSNQFTGKFDQYGIDPKRRERSGIKAAVIREKGINRDRDMAWALYLAGFDVKDVHMTDLISGREDLSDVNMIAFAGGFSNSDVLGSAKGWAGAFLYNRKAKRALDKFYKRGDTLSLGVCNGCQLMVELGLLYPEHKKQPWMSWNDSHKYECSFIGVDILENNSVMLGSLAGSKLGIWVAHGEGKFNFPGPEAQYHIPAKFSYHGYPGNPNGSQFDAACISSPDGRHLAIMPHLEDSVLPWQWPWYPEDRRHDEITPWIEAFINARKWIQQKTDK